MRHKCKKILNKASSSRDSILKNMLYNLIVNKKIVTTSHKAKILKPFAEKMITKYINIDEENKVLKNRFLLKFGKHFLDNKKSIDNFLNNIDIKKNQGGYLKIIKLGFRNGDSAPISLLTHSFLINEE